MGKKNSEEPIKNKKINWWLVAVIFVLLATNGWLSYFYIKNRGSDSVVSENDKYNLLNPARKFVKQEDLIINFQPLRDYLNEKYEADQNISIYFEYLSTGSNIAISKDAEFYPASLLKVPVAMAVAKKIEKGEWEWTNELVLMPADKDDGFGTLYKEASNSTHTIEELVRRSLSDSDNTAHFMLVRNLEVSEIEDVYDHMGLKDFLNTDGALSAKRYSIIFRSLYNSSYLSEENSQKLLSYLSQTPFKEYIQSALPQDVVFVHKIGISEDEKVYLDSGVAYLKNRPYILTIMVKDKSDDKSKEIMKDISGKVYTYISSYKD
jgi:beta-lactamase class A